MSMLMVKMHILQLLAACYKPLPLSELVLNQHDIHWTMLLGSWLGLKISEPLNLASFVNFEDCKQDFVAKFQRVLVALGRTLFFPIPVLNYKAGVICSRGCCMPLTKQSNSCVNLISDMSLPVSWTFTVMIYAGNMIMICKTPYMNPISSNLCLETDMPLLDLC